MKAIHNSVLPRALAYTLFQNVKDITNKIPMTASARQTHSLNELSLCCSYSIPLLWA